MLLKVKIGLLLLAGVLFVLVLPRPTQALQSQTALTFSKTFSPDTIGPGSTTQLRFDIDNSQSPTLVTGLTFTDTLPVGIVIATPSSAATDCIDGVVTAPDGGTNISFGGGRVGAFGSCTVTVNVMATTTGLNTSGDLTSSAGNSGPAVATLTVDTDRPGFSKSFSPNPVSLGSRTTLTFLIDNTAHGSAATDLQFTDNLPIGLVIANPANASTTCTGGIITAVPGTSVFAYGPASSGDASVGAGSSCTVSVDVIGGAVGAIENTSGELISDDCGECFDSSGKATAILTVPVDDITLTKSFTDDPVVAGSSATLAFTITNLSRDFSAISITFSDDIGAVLPSLMATDLPKSNVCGTGSSLIGSSGVMTFSGGTLAAEASCGFTVTLLVPAGTATGSYTNTTSIISATRNAATITGTAATDKLFVQPSPIITKTFLDNPAAAGGTTTLAFTITNTSPISAASDIAFSDEFAAIMQTASFVPADGSACGGSSDFTFTPPVDIFPATFTLSDGSLAAGASCSFTITLNVIAGAPLGSYANTTSNVSATIDNQTISGNAASDTLQIVAGPRLLKEFTDDPVQAGGTVNLQFTLANDILTATNIAFTDDLSATISGLAGTGLPLNDLCGNGNGSLTGSAGDTLLTFTGATLTPGQVCTFSVTLNVPGSATSGDYTNTTSNITATVSGLTTLGNPASDDLRIAGLTLTKAFLDDPAIPGDTVTLAFTLTNDSVSENATGIVFTDTLDDALTGLAAVPPLPATPCGGTLVGTTELSFTGGNLLAGTSCTFTVTVQVPFGAADGAYSNTTSDVEALMDGSPVIFDPATDVLVVNSTLLQLTKEFTDDPVAPGGTVTLEFTLTNLDAGQVVSSITFIDDLGTALSGLVATGLPPAGNVCNGSGTLSGAGFLTFSGGSLAAGASCTFTATLQVPGGAAEGTYLNTTGVVTGLINGSPVNGTATSDDLQVSDLNFSKSFDGPTTAGGSPVLSFTIQNVSTTTTVADLTFADDLAAVVPGLVATGLPASNVCGAGSTLAGTSFLALTNGSLLTDTTCTFTVTLQVPAVITPGTYTNTTSDLFQSGLPVASPATADLEIFKALDFEKTFDDALVIPGGTVALDFSLTNNTSQVISSLTFTDDLESVVSGLTQIGSSSGGVCGLGSLLDLETPGLLALRDGVLPGGGSCAFSVQLQLPPNTVGSFLNSTTVLSGILNSLLVTAEPATDTLDIAALPPLSKRFIDDPVAPGGTTTLRFAISNTSTISEATNISFSDNLNAVVPGLVAATLPISDVCGSGSTLSGTSVISLTGGTLPPSGACAFEVELQVPSSASLGSFENNTSQLSLEFDGNLTTAPAATDTLEIEPLPLLTKRFLDDPVGAGQTVTLAFSLTNTSPSQTLSDVQFTDNLSATLAGLQATTLPDPGCGAGSQLSGSSLLSLTGASLPAGGTCTFNATLQLPVGSSGSFLNTTSQVSALLGGDEPVTGAPASDYLDVVQAPAFIKAFINDPVAPGGTVNLQFSLSLADAAATDIAFSDDLTTVAGVIPQGTFPMANVCGDGSSLALNGSTLELTGGSLSQATPNCTFTVPLTVPVAATPGNYLNTTSQISAVVDGVSVSGDPAVDTLTVAGTVSLVKTFLQNLVLPGDTVSLQFELTNAGPLPATDITFTDNLTQVLPGLTAQGTPLSGVCNSTGTLSGTSQLSLTGASLAPGASCTFSVNVLVPVGTPVSDYVNSTSVVSATIDGAEVVGPAATDSLNVLGPLLLTKVFDDPVAPGGIVSLEFTLYNQNTVPATDTVFSDDLNAVATGLAAIGLPLVDICGPGSQINGTTLLSLSGGNLAAGASCTFSVDLQVPAGVAPGSYLNTTGQIAATMSSRGSDVLVAGSPATDTLDVLALPLVQKRFLDDPVGAGNTVTLQFTVTNTSLISDMTQLAFGDDLEATLSGLVAVALPADGFCGLGSSLTGSSNLNFSGGSRGPGESCTFSVTLQVPAGASNGSYLNTTTNVSAQVPGEARLTVGGQATDNLDVAAIPSLTKSFSDDPVDPGSTVTLEFTLSHQDAVAAATGIAFTDDLNAVLPGLAALGLPASDVCGAGSVLNGAGFLTLSGGVLAPQSTCTFSVTLQVPAGAVPGVYPNTTSALSAQVGGTAVAGNPATDNLVVTVLNLSKSFSDDPVAPGDSVTLAFTLTNASAVSPTNNIAFSDDLDAVLPGLAAVGLPQNDVCGAGSQISGTTVLSMTGGTLDPGASCTFNVTLQVPAGAASADYPNQTSFATADLDGLPVIAAPATDNLAVVELLSFSKSFTDDPVAPGDSMTLEFTIAHVGQSGNATSIAFSDDLNAVLPGLAVVGLPAADVCGGGSQLIDAGDVLSLTNGVLAPQSSCIFSVTLDVPAGAVPGIYGNTTSDLTALVDLAPFSGSPATDDLQVSQPGLIYLPIIFKDASPLPDLIITSLVATTSGVTVTIQNVSNTASPPDFWVDVYFNPTQTPGLNKPWQTIAPAGAVWGVTQPLAAGEVLTLIVGGTYYDASSSSSSFPSGASVYGYVDSIDYTTTYGAVFESDENNLFGPVMSTAGGAVPVSVGNSTISSERLPKR